MTGIALRAQGLGKAYPVYRRPEDRLIQMFLPRSRKLYQDFWALRGFDLEVHRGETVGIVGRNGSGKSTLLQLVAGTLVPTEGELEVNGRISALLELGAGFNPEFTGRENVFTNATILGLRPGEIDRRFAAIEAFADIGDFIDQPVKHYSSGMYARLAFAVAINVDPDILVVDEALSVGDEAFQRKCFARIDEIRAGGATVFFVSHSASSILRLCDRAVLLEHGQRLLTGEPKRVVAMYQKLAYAPSESLPAVLEEIRGLEATGVGPSAAPGTAGEVAGESEERRAFLHEPSGVAEAHYDPHMRPQSTSEYVARGARISNARILDGRGREVNVLVMGDVYQYTYDVHFTAPATRVRLGMMIKTTSGIELAGMASHPPGGGLEQVESGQTLQARFHFRNRLNPETYFLNAGLVGCVDEGEEFMHRVLDILMFRVLPSGENCMTGMVGLAEEKFCELVFSKAAADPSPDPERS